MNSDPKNQLTRTVWPTLMVKILPPQNKMSVHKHFQSSWAFSAGVACLCIQICCIIVPYNSLSGEESCSSCDAGYPSSVPVWYLRIVPASLGALLPVAVYYLMLEFQFSRWTTAVAAAAVIMGTKTCCMLSFSSWLWKLLPLLLCRSKGTVYCDQFVCLCVCVCVCLCICLSAGISLEPLDRSSQNLLCRSPVAMARSFSLCTSVVLWMTSRLAIVGRMAMRGRLNL